MVIDDEGQSAILFSYASMKAIMRKAKKDLTDFYNMFHALPPSGTERSKEILRTCIGNDLWLENTQMHGDPCGSMHHSCDVALQLYNTLVINKKRTREGTATSTPETKRHAKPQ